MKSYDDDIKKLLNLPDQLIAKLTPKNKESLKILLDNPKLRTKTIAYITNLFAIKTDQKYLRKVLSNTDRAITFPQEEDYQLIKFLLALADLSFNKDQPEELDFLVEFGVVISQHNFAHQYVKDIIINQCRNLKIPQERYFEAKKTIELYTRIAEGTEAFSNLFCQLEERYNTKLPAKTPIARGGYNLGFYLLYNQLYSQKHAEKDVILKNTYHKLFKGFIEKCSDKDRVIYEIAGIFSVTYDTAARILRLTSEYLIEINKSENPLDSEEILSYFIYDISDLLPAMKFDYKQIKDILTNNTTLIFDATTTYALIKTVKIVKEAGLTCQRANAPEPLEEHEVFNNFFELNASFEQVKKIVSYSKDGKLNYLLHIYNSHNSETRKGLLQHALIDIVDLNHSQFEAYKLGLSRDIITKIDSKILDHLLSLYAIKNEHSLNNNYQFLDIYQYYIEAKNYIDVDLIDYGLKINAQLNEDKKYSLSSDNITLLDLLVKDLEIKYRDQNMLKSTDQIHKSISKQIKDKAEKISNYPCFKDAVSKSVVTHYLLTHYYRNSDIVVALNRVKDNIYKSKDELKEHIFLNRNNPVQILIEEELVVQKDDEAIVKPSSPKTPPPPIPEYKTQQAPSKVLNFISKHSYLAITMVLLLVVSVFLLPEAIVALEIGPYVIPLLNSISISNPLVNLCGKYCYSACCALASLLCPVIGLILPGSKEIKVSTTALDGEKNIKVENVSPTKINHTDTVRNQSANNVVEI